MSQVPPDKPPAGQPPPSRPPFYRRVPRWSLVAGLVVVVGVGLGVGVFAATRNGGGNAADKAAYVDAIADQVSASGLPTDQARCVATAVVDGIGLQTLQDSATPDQIRESTSGQGLSEFGIHLDAGQANRFYQEANSCVDFRRLFLTGLKQQGGSQQFVDCVDQHLSDSQLEQLIVADFTADQAARQAAARAANEAVAPCRPLAQG